MKNLSLFLGSLLICIFVSAQKSEPTNTNTSEVIVCSDFHITPTLLELSLTNPYVQQEVFEKPESEDRGHRTPQVFLHSADEDPIYGEDPSVRQTTMGPNNDPNKAPIKNWPGQVAAGFRPYDPSGAAGTNHYIQAINGTPFKVFDKNTGANLLTANIGSLWSPATPNDGDPIIMYDKYADRWFISQFGQTGNKIFIAISTTSNPLGSYYTYTFTSAQFPDYLKFGIWADGYYMTSNQATDKVFCFERDEMLIGNPNARAVNSTFTTGATSAFFVPLPADADGGLPTVGTPCPFFCYTDNAWGGGVIDGVKIWNMAVTWGATPTATITLNTTVPTAAFDASYNASWNDINQPGTTQKLDGIGGVPTYRAQWRKWVGYNTLVLNWGVRISASQRSIRWVELRQNQATGVWTLYQEGTYTPDAHERWLGSIAMDDNGSIALCYAKSSTTVYPSLAYTGRLSTDPLGTMSFAEEIAIAGTSFQTGTNRFGDYSQTSMDPDGQTFWHTGEYISSGVKTRVYSFQLPNAAAAPIANFTADNTTPCIGSTVTFTDISSGLPTGWAWTFSPTSITYVGGTSASSQNPQVQFNTVGPYTVTLVATNAIGSDTEIKLNYIIPMTAAALPLVENFEGATFPPVGWTVVNNDSPSTTWGTAGTKGIERRAAAGNTGSAAGSAGINLFDYGTDTMQVDNLISRSLTLVGASAPKMRFKRAYKYYNSATNPNNYHDELRVFVSTDCGSTYGTAVYYKKGVQLATNGLLNTTFTPGVAADWNEDTVDLSAYIGQNIIIKFEISNKYGNNLYLDDINISNTAAAIASVSIVSSDANNSICSGQSVTFTATPTNGGTTPIYQWQVNGVNAGTNSPTFTTTTLTNGQSVTCIMTSNLPGVAGSPATSNAIVTTVLALPSTPTATSNSPVCAGSTINLNTPTVGGASYAWTGPNGYTSTTQNPTIPSSTAVMAGVYSVTVTNGSGCTSLAGTASVVVNATVTPSVIIAITTGTNPNCPGQTTTFTATPTNGGTTPSYQWKKNGVNVGGNSPTYTNAALVNGDIITVVMTSNAVCASPTTITSNAITIVIVATLTPSVVISATSTTICAGASITFTPTPTNGGTAPTYQWKKNGVNVSVGPTYTTTGLVNGDVITVVMTSNSPCASPTTATSNAITITVSSPVTPGVVAAITTGANPSCTGSSVGFTATPTNGGTIPSYQWQVNGVNVGTNTATYSNSALLNGDNVTCIMTSNAGCVTVATATSAVISMIINPVLTPSLSISTGTNPICSGTSASFTAIPSNGGVPSYQWQVGGVNAGTNSASFASSTLANGDLVACIMTSTATCAVPATVTSNAVTMSVTANVTPAVTLSISGGSNPSCEGSIIDFTANPTNGGTTPSYQWQVNGVNVGSNSSVYSNSALVDGDVVTCIMTSNATCVTAATATSAGTTVTINPIPSAATITQNGLVLTSSSATGNQWYLNGLPIIGEINQTITVSQNGIYTVVVTTNSCSSDSSPAFTMAEVSVEDVINVGSHFFIYPNPSNGIFNVVFTSTEIMAYKIELRNVIGQIVYMEDLPNFDGTYTKEFNVTTYGKGEYFLTITNSKNEKIEKVIVY